MSKITKTTHGPLPWVFAVIGTFCIFLLFAVFGINQAYLLIVFMLLLWAGKKDVGKWMDDDHEANSEKIIATAKNHGHKYVDVTQTAPSQALISLPMTRKYKSKP
jgi:uncharacterized membrane protein